MSSSALYAVPLQLSEDYLSKAASRGSPQLDDIEAVFQSVSVRENELKEKFAPEVFGRATHAETNERALVLFQPVFSPITQGELGVRQNLAHGFQTGASIVTDQRSAGATPFTGKFNDVTTTTMRFTVQMDLWRNIFGRMDKADLKSLSLERKKAEIEKEIQDKTFRITLRRLFWSMVANQEALKISEALLKTANTQLKETNQRFKNSVAEADEVARYSAQVSSREGSLLAYQYQREIYLKQLKNLLPELSSQELALAPYDIQNTIDEVVACTATIAGQKTVPYHFTKYDEAITLLKEMKIERAKFNSRYADPDVKFVGAVKATGVSSSPFGPNGNSNRGTYGGTFDDINNTNRTGYEVGIQFAIPLGDKKDKTQRSKEIYDEKRLLAAINATDAQVINTHGQLVKSIGYLSQVIRSQRISSEQLSKRLGLVRKKYEQARVSVNDLVQDQDALLNAELSTINSQLQILNTIFDYLVVFPETPCSFNRI